MTLALGCVKWVRYLEANASPREYLLRRNCAQNYQALRQPSSNRTRTNRNRDRNRTSIDSTPNRPTPSQPIRQTRNNESRNVIDSNAPPSYNSVLTNCQKYDLPKYEEIDKNLRA